MGFIERITEIMKPTSAQEQAEPDAIRTEQTGANASRTEQNGTNNQDNAIQTEQNAGLETKEADAAADEEAASEEKTYSPDEIEAIIAERKKEWEADRLHSLSKDSQIEELKAELLRRDLREKVNARLEEARLPLGVAEFVQYTDEAGTMEHLEKVITTVNQLVQDGVMMRLRGKTPGGLGRASENENQTSDPFAKAFLNAMKN